jgi:hypothetical protein
MKSLTAVVLLTFSFVLAGCDAYLVERRPVYHGGYYANHRPYSRSRVAIVEEDPYYNHSRSYRGSYRPAPYYGSSRVVYLSDRRGRYYMQNGHRIYVNIR